MSEHGSEHGSDESFEDAFGSGGALHVALVDAFTLEGTKHIPEITRSLTESLGADAARNLHVGKVGPRMIVRTRLDRSKPAEWCELPADMHDISSGKVSRFIILHNEYDRGDPKKEVIHLLKSIEVRDPNLTAAAAKLSSFTPTMGKYLSCQDGSIDEGLGEVESALVTLGFGFVISRHTLAAARQSLPAGAGFSSDSDKNLLVKRERITPHGASVPLHVGRGFLDVVRHNLPALAERAETPAPLDAPIEECYGFLPHATQIQVGELLRTAAQLRVVSGIPSAFFKARVIPFLVGKANPGWPFKLYVPPTPRYEAPQGILVLHAGATEQIQQVVLGEDKFIADDQLVVPPEARETMGAVASCFSATIESHIVISARFEVVKAFADHNYW